MSRTAHSIRLASAAAITAPRERKQLHFQYIAYTGFDLLHLSLLPHLQSLSPAIADHISTLEARIRRILIVTAHNLTTAHESAAIHIHPRLVTPHRHSHISHG